jgi:PTH1 family peptidyl-tRNA hydrolase
MRNDERWLVAGLGTPGPWFAGTRHNAGFLVADRLAARHGAGFRWRRARYRVAEFELDGRQVVVVKPQWSINLSGNPVATAMRDHGVPLERLLLVQDDLHFPFGTLRLKRGGGPGGHNGTRSVNKALGSADYARLRFGLGRPPKGQSIGTFVLKEFTAAEQHELPALLDRCADSLEAVIGQGLGAAQNALHAAGA